MGRIPTITSQISAASLRTNDQIGARRATAEDFGADTARALQGIGQGAAQLSEGLRVRAAQRQQETVANAVAQADFTAQELQIRNEVGADAAGYQERVLDTYDQWVDERAQEIEDDDARQDFRDRMMRQRASLSSRAAQYEFGVASENSLQQANSSLTTLTNKLRTSPDGYGEFLQQGFDVIDARADIPETVKAQMRTNWRQSAAATRFEGVIEAAQTVEDVERIQAELRGEGETDWSAEMSEQGYERALALAESAATSIQTKADAEARSAVEMLEARAADVGSSVSREEIVAVQDLVNKSDNPVTAQRFARIVRDHDIVQQSRRLTPAQQRSVIDRRYNNPSLPPRLNAAITKAAQTFGVSAAYLAATSKREYGVFLTGDPDPIDYGKGNIGNNSSAVGPMQFIEGTWMGVAANPEFQAAVLQQTGKDISAMSRAEVLALRGDVDVALLGGAFFTAQNARQIRGALGREPTDAELYMAHFLGSGGASQLFRQMKADPNASAVAAFPQQAAANKSVYYKSDGTPRTLRELYAELGRKHGVETGSETYYEYGDRQTREKVLADTERQLADDPMNFAMKVGVAQFGDLSQPGALAARGEQARAVADYYSIPASEMKPFTKDEAAALGTRLKNGSADDVLSILSAVQMMGGDTARAGMNQLSEVGDVYAYAGGLQMETGQGSVAGDVVRGQKRLEENPGLRDQAGFTRTDVAQAFSAATGGALLQSSPAQRQSIMDAALAHYVETQIATGRQTSFNPDIYKASVQAVLGARQGSPALDDVNGSTTVMPPGVSGEQMEMAMQNMTVADWAAMSVQGLPPVYLTGEVARPRDLANEAQLKATGGGQYRVVMSDGSSLITGRVGANGRPETYLFQPTADRVFEIVERAEAAAPADRPGSSAGRRDR